MISVLADVTLPDNLSADRTKQVHKAIANHVKRMTSEVRTEARRLVYSSDSGIKKGKGILKKSIKSKIYQRGFVGSIKPLKIAPIDTYYANFLLSGVKKRGGWRIKPRGNFMKLALARNEQKIERGFSQVIQSILKT